MFLEFILDFGSGDEFISFLTFFFFFRKEMRNEFFLRTKAVNEFFYNLKIKDLEKISVIKITEEINSFIF